MKFRAAALVALAAVGGLTSVSSAATAKPKPKVCKLVTDATGDANQVFGLVGAGPSSPNEDIVSADIATDASGKKITAVIRLAALAKPDPDSPLGTGYWFNFTADGASLYLNATTTPAGDAFKGGDGATTGRPKMGDATGTFDFAKKEVRITAATAIFSAKATIKPGKKLTSLGVLVQKLIGTLATGGATSSADTADGAKAYTVGDPSCVTTFK